ncbi:MAG: stage II sporulation protein P [Bacillota bacterium]
MRRYFFGRAFGPYRSGLSSGKYPGSGLVLRVWIFPLLLTLIIIVVVTGYSLKLWVKAGQSWLTVALFKLTMPGWLVSYDTTEEEGEIIIDHYAGLQKLFPLLGFNDFSPLGIISSQLWPVSMDQLTQAPAAEQGQLGSDTTGEDIVLLDTDAPARRKEDVKVAIYHTHTGETYRPDDGVERLSGQPGGVVAVGAALARRLHEEHGIGVVHVARINDAVYSRSYLESEKVVRGLLQNYPNLMILVDLHRDAADSAAVSTADIAGRKAARLLLVVGSDARAPFPGWRQNYQLALELAALGGKKYRGLFKGVQVKSGRYNQFLHSGAILLEVGSTGNSRAEAIYAGELFADILAEYLQNNAKNRQ